MDKARKIASFEFRQKYFQKIKRCLIHSPMVNHDATEAVAEAIPEFFKKVLPPTFTIFLFSGMKIYTHRVLGECSRGWRLGTQISGKRPVA